MSNVDYTILIDGVEAKLIPGYDGAYVVTKDGQIWSRKEPCGYGRYRTGNNWRMLQQNVSNKRRLSVMLCIHGVPKRVSVHRILLVAFRGNPPPRHECRHLNGNSMDNRLENLVWGTPKQNQADRIRHGTSNRGESNPSAILTEKKVLRIRRLLSEGVNRKLLSKQFAVCVGTIDAIAQNRTWNHMG